MTNTRQLEFDFDYVPKNKDLATNVQEIVTELTDAFKYRHGKFIDFVCDHIPYGWRVYNKYLSVRRWFISTGQKLRTGVSDEECWNLDGTFAKYILPRLKHYKNMNRMGIPTTMFIKWHPNYEYPGAGNEKDAKQRWDTILDEIIWTFEYIVDDDKFNPFPEELTIKNRPTSEFIGDWFNREKTQREIQVWKEYVDRCETLNKRKKQGLALFAEHYESLWD